MISKYALSRLAFYSSGFSNVLHSAGRQQAEGRPLVGANTVKGAGDFPAFPPVLPPLPPLPGWYDLSNWTAFLNDVLAGYMAAPPNHYCFLCNSWRAVLPANKTAANTGIIKIRFHKLWFCCFELKMCLPVHLRGRLLFFGFSDEKNIFFPRLLLYFSHRTNRSYDP